MPPTLALLIGIGFVLFAFRSDKARGIAIPGLLWPTLWYLIVASRPFGVWLVMWHIPVPGGGSATGGSPIDAFFFLALTLIGLAVLRKRGFSWSEALRGNRWITVLFAFMALSILWSAFPFVSFKRFIKIIGSATMAFVVLTNGDPLESAYTVLRRVFYIHLPMSIVCIKYFRNIGVGYDWGGTEHLWNGISTSKNTLGQAAMLAVVYFAWEVRRSWPERKWRNLHVLYLLMGIYLLKGSEDAISVTSVSVCIFAVFLFFGTMGLRHRPLLARRFVTTIFCGISALVILILIHSVVMFSPDSLFGILITKFGRNITLTDRTFIWHDVYAAASGDPLLGVGFGGFWIGRLANIPWDANMSWVLAEAHNGYIDTYLQIGLIGSALLAIVLITSLRRLLAQLDHDYEFAAFRITLLITIMFINITESTYLRGDHHLWFVMQLAIWLLPYRTPAGQLEGDPAFADATESESADPDLAPVPTPE